MLDLSSIGTDDYNYGGWGEILYNAGEVAVLLLIAMLVSRVLEFVINLMLALGGYDISGEFPEYDTDEKLRL